MFETLTPYLLVAQGIGFVAFFIGMISYQFKEQRTMFAFRVTDDFIWSIHYLMLGALTPALTVFIACVRTFLVVFVIPKHKTKVIIGAILSVFVVCAFTYDGYWANILPAVTAIFYGLSTYFHEDYVKSRVLMAVGCAFWVVIGFVFGSYAEVISSSLSLLSIAVGYGRHRRKGQLHPHAEPPL